MDTLINQCVINKKDTSNMVIVTPKCHDDVLFLMGQSSYYTLENVPKINFEKEKYLECYAKQLVELDLNQAKSYDNPDSLSFLDRDFAAKRAVGHTLHPSISLNRITFLGNYHDPNVLFKKLCAMVWQRPA